MYKARRPQDLHHLEAAGPIPESLEKLRRHAEGEGCIQDFTEPKVGKSACRGITDVNFLGTFLSGWA
jgi:hypothetical protein